MIDEVRRNRDAHSIVDKHLRTLDVDLHIVDAVLKETRTCVRFALVAAALEAGPLKKFYQSIARSEERHYELFLDLAGKYLPQEAIEQRWQELLDIEANIVAELPIRAALH